MEDLAESSRIFEASSLLQTAATALQKIEHLQAIRPSEKEALKWVGNFLPQVDWLAGPEIRASVSGDFSVQATYVRPSFYAALNKLEHHLKKAGIKQGQHVVSFLSDLYKFLQSGGSENDLKLKSKLGLASTLLQELSMGLLVELTNNGLPREEVLLTVP
jgi:hypothetical protein